LRNLILKGTGNTKDSAKPLDGLKIAVDAGNGAGGFFAKDVLAPLGADISASQFLVPDGGFPNHIPNPEDKVAMESISLRTLSNGADLGLIFDTDVDRAAAVDGRGREISRNSIIALAASLIAEDHPGSTVVTDSITSNHLTQFLENDLGLKHLRYKRGYKNVINKGLELNKNGTECWLAIETSGHAAMKDNYFLDDGAYLATKIIIKVANLAKKGKTIDSLLKNLIHPVESREIRMKISCDNSNGFSDELLSDFKAWANEEKLTIVNPNYEGVRINFENGWCLFRKSLHDSIMPLNIESDVAGGIEKICEKLRSFLSEYEALDSSEV